MPDYQKERIIFAIDNGHDLYVKSKFLRYLSNLKAMGTVRDVILGIGSYEGKLKDVYLMNRDDFDTCIQPSGWVDHQKSFLLIPGDPRQSCTLKYHSAIRDSITLGPLREAVPGRLCQSWTYIPETDKYWTV